MLAKMAFLSVLKRPKRTILILLTVALSVFVLEFVSGWVEGMRDRMRRKIVEETAHIVVQTAARAESLDPLEPGNYMEDADAAASRLARDGRVARVETVTPFGALAIAGERNLPLVIYGFQGDTGFFSQVGRGAESGSFPFPGRGIAVSRGTLDLLGSPDAKSLILLTQDADRAPSYREIPVACVFRTDDSEFDDATAFVDAETAADLLGTSGSAELWVRLADPERASEVLRDALPFLRERGWVGRTWSDREGGLFVLIRLMDLFMLMINVIVLIVAATVITNAILMNVFEKQREFGTLRAIGMKRRQQAFLVLLEGAGQGAAGAVLGALLAFPVVLFLKRHGLPIGEASHVFGAGDVMYFGTNLFSTIRNMAFGALIAVAGSLYAALAGTRPSVVEALGNL